MLKKKPKRMTYAQKRIIALIEERKLRKWCIDNGLQHSAIYRIGIGEQAPTYKLISQMVHLIAPIEWLYYTDETLPYKSQLVPQWDYLNHICKFITENKYNYKEIAKKYGIPELTAYNIFVLSRTMPGLAFIRECCKDINPIEFFIESFLQEEQIVQEFFIPDRGDIVNIKGNVVVVLSKKKKIEECKYLTCVPIVANEKNGIELKETQTKGYLLYTDIQTYLVNTKCQINYIENISNDILYSVLKKIREIFE